MVSRFYYRYSLSICEKKTRTNISSYDYLSAYWLLTGTHCNYQVTRNDCAWNEYIKKNQKFIEFGSFKSAHRRQEKFWPSTTTTTTTTTATRRVCSYSEEKRRYEKETALRAMQVAKTSVAKAMDMIQYAMPMQFLSHSSW